jgi:cytochrome c-type biogenesis protein
VAALGLNQFLAFSRRFRPYMRRIEQGAGVVLVATGMLMLTGRFSQLGYYLLDAFPALGRLG